jgi:hypothetical protein
MFAIIADGKAMARKPFIPTLPVSFMTNTCECNTRPSEHHTAEVVSYLNKEREWRS